MNSEIQILAAVLAAVSCSFIQTSSNQIQSALNSTFFVASERFFKPIYVPDIVKHSEDPKTLKTEVSEAHGTETEEINSNNSLESEEIFQESKVRENYSNEDPKTVSNPLKFSSRYSTKQKDSSKERTSRSKETEKLKGDETNTENSSRIIETLNLSERTDKSITSSTSNDIPSTEKHKSFSGRSDELDDSDEESEKFVEIASTTNEPYSELPKPTLSRKYSDEDFDNYDATSAEVEETDDSEETEKEDEEDKSSVGDYYNSGSKNYHSIQTPLDEIRYRGPHPTKDKSKPEKIRPRLIGAISRRPASHNWPYSKSQVKEQLEKLNEISNGDESYEKILDEEVKEEVKTGPQQTDQTDLELAVEKDEFLFDRNKKYNHINERNHQKQQQKSLSIEEEKDDRVPLLQSLKQHQVGGKESNYQPKVNIKEEGIWPTKSTLFTAPKNTFNSKTPTGRQPKNFNLSHEPTPNFQNHRFLGPIVFKHNLEQPTFAKTRKQPVRNIFLKGLQENEKLDHDKHINQKIQKSIFENESKETLNFNHLEESEEIYNAILANIRSVFGLRIQPGKSSVTGQKELNPEIKLDESKSFTWSLPLKRVKIN